LAAPLRRFLSLSEASLCAIWRGDLRAPYIYSVEDDVPDSIREEERRSMSEVKCLYGSSTERPCPRPGTVQWEGQPAHVRVCEVHAALEPLKDEVTDLGVALEVFNEWARCAEELDNQPLLGLLARARGEFRERLEFLQEQHEALRLAGR
jgi:hypothetical protein